LGVITARWWRPVAFGGPIRSVTEGQRRRCYLSLNGVERNFREQAARGILTVLADAGDGVVGEIERLEAEFPDLGPPLRAKQLRNGGPESRAFFNLQALLAIVSVVLGRLRAALEEDANTPVTEVKEFKFVRDSALRTILQRDYLEIQRAYVAQCWKSVIILAGGAIEAILLDLVLQNENRARASLKAPNQSDLTRWDLRDLIAVCVDLRLVSSGVERLSSPVREYRNLVHPGNELRSKLVFGAEEARIALEVLNMVHRDLS
jgi:hypothetical protein